MTKVIPIAFDCETFPIAPGAVLPKMVCASFAWRDEQGNIQRAIFGNSPLDELPEKLAKVLQVGNGYLIVTHAGEYDYGVALSSYPQLTTLIWEKLLAGECTDTVVREKLLNLSTSGKLEMVPMPDGSVRQISYSLAALVQDRLGIDISADKNDTEESWRTNYEVLDGWQAADYPEDASRYAGDDAEHTLLVYEDQEEQKARSKCASTATEGFQLASAFGLKLMTAWGMAVNGEAVEEMKRKLAELLEANKEKLIAAGILQPAEPERVQMRNGNPVIARTGPNAGQPKMVAARPEKINTKPLQDYARALYKRLGISPTYTEGTAQEPNEADRTIQLDGEIQEFLASKDPVMAEYHTRKSVAKLTQNQLPAFDAALAGLGVMHFNYDPIKETGRTASFGARKGRPMLYPCTNGQQIPNEIQGFDPRRNYKPRPGTVFFDVDYTALELACVGQITYNLFGESVHLSRYNEGYDLHAFLASQLAIRQTTGIAGEFAQHCRNEGILGDHKAVYDAFMLCKKSDNEEVAAFYKHFRNFAKPVGLGYPGGLGPETQVEFARATYGVLMTVDQATESREMWREVYPEMPRFFDWLNGQTDDFNDGPEGKLYWYESPLGMIRRGASFCAAANGMSMQTPGAEGAKAGACINVVRECYDPSLKSVLFGCRPIAFVHDQLIGETTEDSSIWHEQATRVRDIMCSSMELVLPDIKMRSDEALLTEVWTKAAQPVRDENGRLIPWTPK